MGIHKRKSQYLFGLGFIITKSKYNIGNNKIKFKLSMEFALYIEKFKCNMGNCTSKSKRCMELVLFIGNPKYTWKIITENEDKPCSWKALSSNKLGIKTK